MANLGTNFDASQVPHSSLIPKGDYLVRIVESDVVQNSAQTGTILKLTLELLEGQFQGKRVYDSLNITNPNEMAVRISRERLSGYCHATGVIQLQDSQQLHGIPFIASIRVKVDKNGDYDDRNEIGRCKAAAGTQSQPQGGFPAQNQGGFNQQPQQTAFQTQPNAFQAAGTGYANTANTQAQPQVTQVATQQAAGIQNAGTNHVDNSPVAEMNFTTNQNQQAQQVQQQQVQQQQTQQAAETAPWMQ